MEPVSRATADVYVDGKKEGGGRKQAQRCAAARAAIATYMRTFFFAKSPDAPSTVDIGLSTHITNRIGMKGGRRTDDDGIILELMVRRLRGRGASGAGVRHRYRCLLVYFLVLLVVLYMLLVAVSTWDAREAVCEGGQR